MRFGVLLIIATTSSWSISTGSTTGRKRGRQPKRVIHSVVSCEETDVTALHHVPIGAAALPGDREVDVLSDYAVPSSFPAFYAANFRRAVALAIVLTGSPQAAEDLVQDAMADAHRRWKKISAYENPSSWLNRAIVNRSVSLRRRLMSRERGNAVLAASGEPTAEIDARDAELWSKVRKLPARQAQLVALVYVQRLTLPEAAETLGIALPTAKTHLARAKERLARDLEDWKTS
jgi:RNA polymerase sigma factor (sigma-70 family)